MVDRSSLRFALIGAVGIALGGVASGALWPPPQTGDPVLAGRPECPHDWPFKHEQMEEIGSNLHVPEFNDCQRFIEVDGGQRRYGDLFAVFAAESLTPIHRAASTGGSPFIRDHIPEAGLVVAKIYAEGGYDYLGIQPPMNCVVLVRTGDSILARMVQVGSADSSCRSVSVTDAPGKWLRVHERRGQFDARDYPPVARWDWDEATGKQFIGFGCAAAWCEVGDDDYQPPDTLAGSDRTRTIKGWYDQQLLSYFPSPGNIVPSVIRGTIYPTHDSLRMSGQYKGQWVRVAVVTLEPLPGADPNAVSSVARQYKERFNYELTDSPGDLNIIYLCQGWRSVEGGPVVPGAPLQGSGPPATCPMQPINRRGGPRSASVPPGWAQRITARMMECTGGDNWWAMVDPAGTGMVEYYCITRREPGAYFRSDAPNAPRIPPTARWRWMAIDEGTWSECDVGCCEKLGG